MHHKPDWRTVEQTKHSGVPSIEIIYQYNPSRKLNKCINITAKQRHVCDDSELSLWLYRAVHSVVEKRRNCCLRRNVWRPEMPGQNCWPDVVSKSDIRAFWLFVFVASDKTTLLQWHFLSFRYYHWWREKRTTFDPRLWLFYSGELEDKRKAPHWSFYATWYLST